MPLSSIGDPPELRIYLIDLACFNEDSDFEMGSMVKISVKPIYLQILGSRINLNHIWKSYPNIG